MLKKLLKRLQCSLCCGSKCSLKDLDGDGIPDKIIIERETKSDKSPYYV